MQKIKWSCITIGIISIVLSICGFLFPPDGFIGFNLPFQFLLLLNSLNRGHSFIGVIQSPLFDYIFSIILVISGIGTIWIKPWGRIFAYIYSISIMLLSIIGMPMNFIVYIIKEFIRISKETSFMVRAIWGEGLTYFFSLLGTLTYPIILLIFFSRPKIKKKFAGIKCVYYNSYVSGLSVIV